MLTNIITFDGLTLDEVLEGLKLATFCHNVHFSLSGLLMLLSV